jgi:Ca-activated chloride channel family protein
MRLRILILAPALATTLAIAGCSKNTGTAPNNDANKNDGRGNTSTFALDVDTASYTYAARTINDGSRVDAGKVRPEEFVNYFDQNYPEPPGDGFTVQADGARLPSGNAQTRILRVGLQTRSEDAEERHDANLTFVIDISGSMAEAGRLDLVQDALHYLVDQLRPTDAVAIVTFNDKSHVVREMTRASDAGRLHAAIDSLKAGGSTNLGQGLSAGYQLARDSFRPNATNRVILLSDGLANTGTTDADTMLKRIRDEADKQITLLGVGVGSDYGDALMERLADRGDGFVVYISERKQARDLFVHKLPATLAVRAYDAKAQVVFDRATVESFHLVGYEDRALNAQDFRDDTVDGGEVGPGHSVTALYIVRLRPSADGHVADVKVRWLDPKTREASERRASVDTGDLEGAFFDSAATLQISYVAAMFAEYLRGHKTSTLEELIDLAEGANAADDGDPKVNELIALMRRAERL